MGDMRICGHEDMGRYVGGHEAIQRAWGSVGDMGDI